jgi:Calcium binding
MKRPKRDPVREDRIHNEAIVDASPEEQAMSWYYYLDSKISFPFQAKCLAANAVSPLRKGEAVEVLRMATEGLRARHAGADPLEGSEDGGPFIPTESDRSGRING